MKTPILAALACVCFGPLAAAAATGDVTAPIHQFIDGFNTGDVKSAAAAYAPSDTVIIDEFPPHQWSGPKALQDWAADYGRNAQATGVSDGSVRLGEATRTEIEGNRAYVIVPSLYTYKEHGRAMAEAGQMTFVLKGGPDHWKITGWTWSGPKPHAAP